MSAIIITSVSEDSVAFKTRPNIDGAKLFRNGHVTQFSGRCRDVTSPIINETTGERIIIGTIAQNSEEDAVDASMAAKLAWNFGSGEWPQMSLEGRISALYRVIDGLRLNRDEIINTLMWEICKNNDAATSEFDRTMDYIDNTIVALRESDRREGEFRTVSGITAKFRRNAIGVMMLLGPFNYPFNETYATLIPALLMGNVVVMKLPSVGGLSHVLSMNAFAAALPPGVINFISGSGKETMPPVMKTGPDIFAFIGGHKVADSLLRDHPAPHRLKVYLSLEGKNLGLITKHANLTIAAKECMSGATSFNGQRCTAIKIIMVHSSVASEFIAKLADEVNALKGGLPWEKGVSITPLPQQGKVEVMLALIEDALEQGAKVINSKEGGGNVFHNLMRPAIVFPVTEGMRLWHEEQFGPVIPVAIYEDIDEVKDYIRKTPFGLQASIFSTDAEETASLVDTLSTAVGRININNQCSRSPDVFPFTGRKSSGLGSLSITEAVKNFSVETVVAFKQNESDEKLIKAVEGMSSFLTPL